MGMLFKKENKVVRLPISSIIRSPNQPREIFDHEEIVALSQSITENGIIQPIVVRKTLSEQYELIAGERRVKASICAGLDEIPCIVLSCDDEQAAVLSLIENIQRKDLDPFEEALAIKKLIINSGQSQEIIAKKLGKSQSAVANKLRILQLSNNEIFKIRQAKLSERHARALIRIKEKEEREKIIDKIISNNLNVKQTEDLVESYLNGEENKKKKKVLIKDIRIFVNTISKALKLMKQSGIDARSIKNETDSYIEYVIKIPKGNA